MNATCTAHLILLDLKSTIKQAIQGGAEIMNLPIKNPDHKVTTAKLS